MAGVMPSMKNACELFDGDLGLQDVNGYNKESCAAERQDVTV
jgi:hypothetical protein